MRLLILLGLLVVEMTAGPLKFSSGDTRTHLVELYTSEGCSSCPPAEKWLGRLSEAPGLWRDFVPVAFHVVYWDNLGWKDRFASREYTERQYAYANRWGGNKVYTPGFVLDGEEWRGAFGAPPKPAKEKSGVLTVEYGDDATCYVSFTGEEFGEVHVALLGSGITSRIAAGENRGRTLEHDFVTLALKTSPLKNGVATVSLKKPEAAEGMTKHAIAVWVTAVGQSTPLQATGGWLP
jgi:hypothetical protein